MQMSKKEEFLEVADKIVEALDQEVVPFSDLVSIACEGKTEQNCSQCDKKIVVQGIFLHDGNKRTLTAEIVFYALETKRYICESSECNNKERDRNADKFSSWATAVHKICCNPDMGQRQIDERKVKTGGKDKVFAANAETKSLAERMSKLKMDPASAMKLVEIIEETKKAKRTVAKIDEVD